jgi:hypothetical protein
MRAVNNNIPFKCFGCGKTLRWLDVSDNEVCAVQHKPGECCHYGRVEVTPERTFDEWLDEGIRLGYCSEQFCETHSAAPMTDKEEQAWTEGTDVCIHLVRLGSPDDWDQDFPDLTSTAT